VVDLDRDRAADLTHPGLNPDWQLRGRTAFDDDGRLRRVEIMMAGSASPETSMRATVEFIRFDQAAAQIDLPLESVDLTGYLNAPSLKQ
jgi:xanthine dehydrogenase molybdopterin-binding subunit B